MNRIILDTDVASFIFKDRLPPTLLSRLGRAQFGITYVTLGELAQWVTLRNWGPRNRARLNAWIASKAVLPYSDDVARMWGDIRHGRSVEGVPGQLTTRGWRLAVWCSTCRWPRSTSKTSRTSPSTRGSRSSLRDGCSVTLGGAPGSRARPTRMVVNSPADESPSKTNYPAAVSEPSAASSRRVDWGYEEIVVVCDAVVANGWRGLNRRTDLRVAELSQLLRRAAPLRASKDPKFRNVNGVGARRTTSRPRTQATKVCGRRVARLQPRLWWHSSPSQTECAISRRPSAPASRISTPPCHPPILTMIRPSTKDAPSSGGISSESETHSRARRRSSTRGDPSGTSAARPAV